MSRIGKTKPLSEITTALNKKRDTIQREEHNQHVSLGAHSGSSSRLREPLLNLPGIKTPLKKKLRVQKENNRLILKENGQDKGANEVASIDDFIPNTLEEYNIASDHFRESIANFLQFLENEYPSKETTMQKLLEHILPIFPEHCREPQKKTQIDDNEERSPSRLIPNRHG